MLRGLTNVTSWLPAADGEVRWRALLLVRLMLLGVGVSIPMIGFFVALGSYFLAANVVFVALSLVLTLLTLRVTRSLTLAANLVLGLSLGLFAVSAGAEEPLDGAGLAWLGLVPFVAHLLLSHRAALVWSAISAASAISLVVGRNLGLIGAVSKSSVEGSLVRAVGLGVVFFLFARQFDRERRRALAEAQRINRARSAFLANMSHEIRTPMNGVLGMIEVLLHGEVTPEQREQLGLAHRSGEALITLINDLLDMSKIEAGKLEVVLGDFALRPLLRDVHDLFRPLAEQKRLALELEVAEGVPDAIRGDALRLRQVLGNLVNNGLKFTAAGKVAIAVSAPGPGRLHFEVADTGIGIAADVLPRLMVPFAQADASTTRRFGGTGLGLALSRELVGLMGGALSVETEPGRGTRFHFELPLEAAREPLPSSSAVAVALPAPHAPRLPVLVVDDNPINLRVATSLVERAGFPTCTATNGREALEALQRERFALVLMDCHMPEMDGYETTERLRAMPGELATTPVVALTASAMREDLDRCTRAGMNECLTKPIAYGALVAVLRRFESKLRHDLGA